jgi:hypothetical protein
VLIPLAAAALMMPLAAASMTGVPSPTPGMLLFLLLSAFVPGALATAYIGFDLPSAGDGRHGYGRHLALCLIPLTIAAVQFNLLWAWMPYGDARAPYWDLLARGQQGLTWVHFGTVGLVMHGGGMMAGIVAAMARYRRPAPMTGVVATLAALGTGFVGGVAASRFAALALHPAGSLPPDRAPMYTVVAFPIVLGAFLLAATLLVGLTSYVTKDKDREWWARSGGLLLAVGLAWPIFSAVVLLLTPALVGWTKTKLAIHGATGLIGWAVSQLAGSEATSSGPNGQTAGSTATSLSTTKELAAKLLLPVFLLLLAVSIAILNTTLASYAPAVRHAALQHFDRWLINAYCPLWIAPAVRFTGDLWLMALSYVLLAVVASYFINVNSFSLHGMYRQRLIRAYLGASHTERQPNPFTGFDEDDNMAMCALTAHRPLHVINMTLNLVHGSNLAWQERKAESFTVTRLHAGSCRLGYRPAAIYGGRDSAFQKNKSPITLGTAMTISGAAASPNMGYNSSPLLTLVMTLFNARLGWWLGNPKYPSDAWKLPGPRLSMRPFIDEAFGLTDDENEWIYLSDGGHFENLGLYEMVLRRCEVIVVSDAGADPLYGYEDLGNAVRKIRIDLGIAIDFDLPMPMSPARKADPQSASTTGHHCAIGSIRYDVDDRAQDGILVYLKPSLTGDEPLDVLHYATTDPTFPHQTTVDQFFGEAQFESYRRLGAHIVERICEAGKPPQGAAAFGLAEFVNRSKVYRASPNA